MQANPASALLKIEDQASFLEVTEESKIIYLRRKQMRLERKRDKQYKKVLNVFQESKRRRQMMRQVRMREALKLQPGGLTLMPVHLKTFKEKSTSPGKTP